MKCMANEIVICENILDILWKNRSLTSFNLSTFSNILDVQENAVHIIHRASKLA